MLRRAAVLAVVLATCAFATEAQTPPSLIVQRAGPDGELATLDQANEIRVVFSEPMVTLGRIPQPATAPFVRIEPAIRGTFRWSGTTILIFTPDPRQPLPYATTYRVTVDTSARAVSGRQLTVPYSFRFTTPVVRLLAFDHQRVNGPGRVARDLLAQHLRSRGLPGKGVSDACRCRGLSSEGRCGDMR